MSSSLFTNDRSGVFLVMLGFGVVIVVAVVLSLVADGNRLALLSSPGQDALRQGERRMRELRSSVARLKERQAARERAVAMETRTKDAVVRLDAVLAEEELLRDSLAELERDIAASRAALGARIAEHRRSVWKHATGTRLDRLVTTNGTAYQDVVITKVTGIGIALTHRTGSARLEASKLPRELLDRFLLDRNESARLLREEAAPAGAGAARPPAAGHRDRPPRSERAAGAPPPSGVDDQRRLHAEIAQLRFQHDRLTDEIAEAVRRFNATDGRRSVPRSLETWEERAAKLRRMQSSLSLQILKKESELRAAEIRQSVRTKARRRGLSARTHRIFSPTNRETSETNQPNACSLCHLEAPIDWTIGHLDER